MTQPKIRIRDINEQRVGTIDKYTEAVFIPKWNGVGTWSLKIAANAPGAEFITPGCGVSVVLSDGSDFSGHATQFVDEWNTEGDDGDGTITIAGVEDKAMLGYRVVLPVPGADYTAQTAAANYTITGQIETIIKRVVSDNIGSYALPVRMVPNFNVMPDRATGPSTSVSLRYDNLLDTVQRLASPVQYGFSVVSVPGGWNFDVKPNIDASNRVKFARKLGNMTAYTFGRTAPTLTRAIVAGSGAGVARNVRTYDQVGGAVDPSWGFLLEGFIDRRDTSSSTDMLQAATEAFASGGEGVSLAVTVLDTDDIKIGRDYGLGSIVAAEVRGVVYNDIISQVQYSYKPDEIRITPTIGGGDAVYGKALDVYRVVRSISARLALLERRQ